MNNSKSSKRDNGTIKDFSNVPQQWPEVQDANNKVIIHENVNNESKPSAAKKTRLNDKVTITEELDDDVLQIL